MTRRPESTASAFFPWSEANMTNGAAARCGRPIQGRSYGVGPRRRRGRRGRSRRQAVRQLTALIAAAEAKRQEKREGAVAALRAEMERKAAELGLSPGELFAQTGQQPSMQQAARGRRPRGDTGT